MTSKSVEIGVKHDTGEIDSRSAFVEGKSISNDQCKVTDLTISFRLEKFPKEFQKNLVKSVDQRFLFMLICSAILNVGSILLLQKIVPSENMVKSISRMQEQYAKFLVKNEPIAPPLTTETYGTDYKIDSQLLTGLTRWMDTFTNNILESIKDIPALNEPFAANTPKELRVLTSEQYGIARQSATSKRRASLEGLEKEVNSIGLLGVISSDTKSIDHEYVQDVLEYASENSSHLAKVLAKLNAIEVPRYGNYDYLSKIRKNLSGSTDEFIGLKGGRTSAENEIKQIVANVEPLKPVETAPMKRNVQYEQVPSSDINTLSNSSATIPTRSAQDVMRIIQSHTRALQDCYKQELRYDPNISGKIIVRFTIDPDGVVTNASLVSSTLNSPRMEECILNRIKRWRNFPPCDPSIGEKTYRQSFGFGEKK